MKHLISFKDWPEAEVQDLLQTAVLLKENLKTGYALEPLKGKSLGMIFEKPSNRTRLSFEIGMYQLGGQAIYIQEKEIGMGNRETVSDVSRVFSRYLDGVLYRTRSHQELEEFSSYSSIPVINGLSDLYHPCQALADVLTIYEKKQRLKGVKFVWIGDGNNVCRSLIEIANKFEMNMVMCCPEGYEPDQVEHLDFEVERDPYKAAENADVIYTDVWISMGQEEEAEQRRKTFKPYCVTEGIIKAAADDVIFMHCLPAVRDEEVSTTVLEGPHSVVFDQAENRLHAQKSILVRLLGGSHVKK